MTFSQAAAWEGIVLLAVALGWSYRRRSRGRARTVEVYGLTGLGEAALLVAQLTGPADRDAVFAAAVWSAALTSTAFLIVTGCRTEDPRRLFRSNGWLCRLPGVGHVWDAHYRVTTPGATGSAVVMGEPVPGWLEQEMAGRGGAASPLGAVCARCGRLQ